MLRDYRGKRDFKRTPEPPAGEKTSGEGPLTFVVQKHAARQLHYDFRLELDGVLKSWAVAKGPSANPADKRLAVMVEDHPLDYASFEGSIPKGEYGAGQVIVWDRGTYSPDEDGELNFDDRGRAEERMRAGLDDGKLSITLRGEKMKGSWTLVRMKNRGEKNWLLIKHKDEHADAVQDIQVEGESAISGLTIDDLKAGYLPQEKAAAVRPEEAKGALKKTFPAKIAPMLASLTDKAFKDDNWLFEPKLDGFRTIAFINGGRVKLQSRRGVNVTEHYPELAESLQKQPASQMVLDGEIIALDSKGRLCFQCLQGYLKSIRRINAAEAEPPSAIIYYVFDILYLDGHDLRGVPLRQRQALLKGVLDTGEGIRLVEHFEADGPTVYRAAIENGLEGIVAKRQDSLYETGKRSANWLKVKAVTSDEFIVCGYTQGNGARAKTFGALLLGYYDDDNKLRYAGNVGSGFDDDTLKKMRKQFDRLERKTSPFGEEPEQLSPVTWLRPEMVVEVKFSEWTRDKRLRAPVFLRVREDKPAEAVHPAKAVERSEKSAENLSGLDAVLAQLGQKKDKFVLEVEGGKLSLSNLDKPIWPSSGEVRPLTKRDLLTYLARVSPLLLPHLRDRPLSLNRFPNGINGQHFFQKHYEPRPEFVETVPLSSHDTPARDYLLCNNLATLLWLGQIADLELHTWYSRVTPGPDLKVKAPKKAGADFYADYPDFIVFDIDPYIYSGNEKAGEEPELNRTAFKKTCQAARWLKETLDSLKFPSFVKTSGRTGLHVFVPVLRSLDYHAAHSVAETICRFVLQQHPDDLTVDWAVEKRKGKIFLDYNQNVRGKTLASLYSPRPSPEASVSLPLRWDELDKVYPTDFTILNAMERLDKTGDLWSHILEAKIDPAELMAGIKGGK